MSEQTPPGDGWFFWLDHSPSDHGVTAGTIEIWKKALGNETSFSNYPVHPGTNIAGIWWRPA